MTRHDLIEAIVSEMTPDDFSTLVGTGALAGGVIGMAYPAYKHGVAMRDLRADAVRHMAQAKKGTSNNITLPKGVTRVTNRDELSNWVKGPGNVTSRIPLIGTPIKRFVTKQALKSGVPSAKKGWRGAIANLSFDPLGAGYMAPSEKTGTGAVLGHRDLPPEIIQHEIGHAKDFAGMTHREIQKYHQTKARQGGLIGSIFGKHTEDPTYQSEVTAWDKSGVRGKNKYRDNALKTYEYGHKMGRYNVLGTAIGAGVGALAGGVGYLLHKNKPNTQLLSPELHQNMGTIATELRNRGLV